MTRTFRITRMKVHTVSANIVVYLTYVPMLAQDQEAPEIEISIEIAPGSFFTIAVSKVPF